MEVAVALVELDVRMQDPVAVELKFAVVVLLNVLVSVAATKYARNMMPSHVVAIKHVTVEAQAVLVAGLALVKKNANGRARDHVAGLVGVLVVD